MALKIDRLDSKKCTPETATKSYIEVLNTPSHPHTLTPSHPLQVRAEVSLLHKLTHPHVIDFIGVVLHPLCFVLEWATGGSLHSVLTRYKKVDARIGPRTLQQTTLQVIHGCSCVCTDVYMYTSVFYSNVCVY